MEFLGKFPDEMETRIFPVYVTLPDFFPVYQMETGNFWNPVPKKFRFSLTNQTNFRGSFRKPEKFQFTFCKPE